MDFPVPERSYVKQEVDINEVPTERSSNRTNDHGNGVNSNDDREIKRPGPWAEKP